MFLVTNIIYSLSDSYWTYDSNNCYNIKVEIKDKTSLKYTIKYKIFYELMVTQFLLTILWSTDLLCTPQFQLEPYYFLLGFCSPFFSSSRQYFENLPP